MPDSPTAEDIPAELRDGHAGWERLDLRYGDMDVMQHVNNVAIASFFETARVRFMRRVSAAAGVDEIRFSIARLELEFHREMTFPGTVAVGSRIAHVGRTSCRVAQTLVHAGARAATSEAVAVHFDIGTRRPVPLPDPVRRILVALLDGRIGHL